MWRHRSHHEQADTEFLEAALARIAKDDHLRSHADAVLEAARASEPLIHDALRTPQSPPHHCEGPFIEDHVRLMLTTLQAVVEGKMHLIDIEEFRALKGYEGEIEELEEMLKENAALFEVFCLCHDAAKWATMSFSAEPGSEGEKAGLNMEKRANWEDTGISERAKMRERFMQLWNAFASSHEHLERTEQQSAFFNAYQIRIHYYGHDRAIHSPAYRGLLKRLGSAHRLPDRDVELLEDVIAHHLEPGFDFGVPNPGRVERYIKLATARGYDADDFIDILQGGVFLDLVCGSQPHAVHILVNFLRSEHDHAPWKRALKEQRRDEERKRERQRVFREVGLDGVALMDLLGMEPGPAFGKTLRVIQEAIVEGKPLPSFSPPINKQLSERLEAYYEAMFDKETD